MSSTIKYVYYDLFVPLNVSRMNYRNCAFNASAHLALLSPNSKEVSILPSTTSAPGIDILPYILLPLAGPEEFDLEVRTELLVA